MLTLGTPTSAIQHTSAFSEQNLKNRFTETVEIYNKLYYDFFHVTNAKSEPKMIDNDF